MLLAGLLCLLVPLGRGAPVEVEFRLVAQDRPEVTVDKLEHERPITNPVSTGRGVEMEKIGLDVACWARNVRLDGQPLFERYHEGKYIDRLPIARAKLNPGDHTIWPGNHVFTVTKEGNVTTADPELIVDVRSLLADVRLPFPRRKPKAEDPPILRVKCYPVTFRAYRANPDEADLPMSMRLTPLPHLTIRESADHEQDAARPKGASSKALELLPLFGKFAPLTIWLPANKVGKGYVAHPIGLTFHLGADGILPGAGGGESVEGLRVRSAGFSPSVPQIRPEGRTTNVVEIPLYGYPVDGAVGARAVVPGVEQFTWSVHQAGETLMTNWYPRRAPYELQVSKDGPSIAIEGALRPLPLKSFRVDIADPATGTQRALAVETATRHLTPGGTLHARIRAMQATPPTKNSRAGREGEAPAEPSSRTESGSAGASPSQEPSPSQPPNPLENSPRFGQLQLYGSQDWVDLKLEPKYPRKSPTIPSDTLPANGEAKVSIPDVPDGVYRLRLGVRPADPAARPLSADRWVSIARPRPAGVGLFTPRGRDAFYRGESFCVALGVIAIAAPVAAGTPVEVDIVDDSGRRRPLRRSPLPRNLQPAGASGRETLVVRLSAPLTLSLAAGHYRIEARVGQQACRPLVFDLVEPTPRTHFTNMLIGKYNILGDYYQRLLRTGEGAEEFVREIVAVGYNAFMGMTYDVNRVSRHGLDIEQLVRERPELGPWESYYQPSGRDRFLNAAVRHNLRFYENLFTYNDTMLPREPRVLDACERFASLEVASMRHSPAFQGVCLYDEIYTSSDAGTVRPVVDAFYKAEEMSYREKNKGMTSPDALKALDRFAGRPVGQRRYEDLAKFRTWPAHQDAEWADFSARIVRSVKAVMPASQNFTLQRFWGGNGGNIAPNGTPDDVFAPLDAAACVMYKDGGYGDRPVFAPMQADVLRTRDDLPVWTQLHTFQAPGLFGPHIIRQAFFALSQRIDGLTFFTIPYDYRNPSALDWRDTIRDIAARLTTPCGDFFLACQRGYRRVGIYYSREADYLTLRKPEKLAYACEGLWVACMRAGFPADFLYDRQIRAGRGMDYDVLFVPGFVYEDEAPPETLAALKKLLEAGKTIVVERSSRLPLEGIVRLDSNLDEYDDKLGGAFPRNVDFETEMVWDQSEETTKLVGEFLAKRIPPAAISDSGLKSAIRNPKSPMVLTDWLKCGQGEYLVIPNFAPAPFTGLYKTLYQAPDQPTLRFPKRPPVCYDLLEMRRVDVATDGDWMTLQADLRSYPGKVYAFLPAPIDKVDLQVGTAKEDPADLQYHVAVLDAAGKRIEAGFPIQITLTDPSGKVALDICRAAAPEFRGAYRLPLGSATAGSSSRVPTGTETTWKLRVRELISGAFAEATIGATAGLPSPPYGGSGQADRGTEGNAPVWARDGAKIRELLSGKGQILIAVDDDQPWVKEHAEGLAASLIKQGREAKVVRAADVIHLPLDWDSKQPVLDGTRLWRGDVVQPGLFVDAPLILLGKRYENRLIEALIRRDLLAEPFSENLPGQGKAMLAWTRRAFSNQHDMVAVLAGDKEGLQAGIAHLLAIAAGGKEVERESVERGAPEPENAKAPAAAPSTLHTPPSTAMSSGKAPSSYRNAVSSEDHIRCVDVEPASGRVVVGTHGYGHNLFCLSGEGKLLWKQFLPEHNVYFARWLDAGVTPRSGATRVVAATGRGFFFFLLDGTDGRVLKKFAATEWPLLHGGYTGYQEGAVNTEVPIALNPPLRQILIAGLTGLMAVDYDGKKMWYRDRAEAIAAYPPEAIQSVGAEFGRTVVVGGLALSPDGTKVVHSEYEVAGSTQKAPGEFLTVWRHKPVVLDARTGQVLAENRDDPGNQTSPSGWDVGWAPAASFPVVTGHGEDQGIANFKLPIFNFQFFRAPKPSANWGDSIPVVHTMGLAAPLLTDGRLGTFRSFEGRALKDGGRLVATPTRVERFAADGRPLWQIGNETIWLPELDQLSPDESRLFRCDREGLVRCLDLKDGRRLWEQKLPFCAVLCPVGEGVAAGAKNGVLARINAGGRVLWETRLRDLHELPGHDYPGYLQSALRRDPDSTREFFPVGEDRPGDYDGVLRMGLEQLANGGFEAEGAWSSEAKPVRLDTPAHSGAKALALEPGQLVSQRLKARVIPSATYLLEFFYRVEDERTHLAAGSLLKGDKETLTAAKFTARPGEWTFGRLAVKSMADTKALDVGFEAEGGAVRVDDVSLRPIRFPSANLLANDELHTIEPTYVRDYRVLYDRIPRSLAEKLMRQNHVVGFRQGGTTTGAAQLQEQAFLHNGRLDDVGSRWFYQPDFAGFSVVLAKSAYVSHLVLYLNNTTPDSVYRTMSIVANNLETKLPQAVALVRSNRRRFVVVHFPELLHTDAIKILPGMHRTHRDCLTEVEVYGALGGPAMAKQGRRFTADPEATPMLMGNPSHVPSKLPADLVGEYREIGRHRIGRPVYGAGGTAADGVFTFNEAEGPVRSIQLRTPDPKEQQPRYIEAGPAWPVGTVTPISTPARYAARLVVGSADAKVHAVADNGMHLWGFATGGRVYSSPAPDGDEVYFGSDDGKLYKVDIDSGIPIWEFATGDKIRSSPALAGGKAFVASWDGFLYAVDAATGREAWKAPLAKFTRSSPAVFPPRVFIGDEQGYAHCFDAATGKPLWKQPVGKGDEGRGARDEGKTEEKKPSGLVPPASGLASQPAPAAYISFCPVVTDDGVFLATEGGAAAFFAHDGNPRWKRDLGTRLTGQPMATQTQLLVPSEKGLLVLRRSDGQPDGRFVAPSPYFEGWRKTPPPLAGKVVSVVPYSDKVFLVEACARVDWGVAQRPYATYEGFAVVWAPAPKTPPAAPKK